MRTTTTQHALNMNSKPEKMSAVLESALTANNSLEIVIISSERPALESIACLCHQMAMNAPGMPMLSVPAVRAHYEDYFRIPDDRVSMITVDELEDRFCHQISLTEEDDDGWGEEYLEPGEDITGDRYRNPTAEELNDWKLAVLELMGRRFDMLQEANSKA
jgi:hypothetical protein